MGQDPGLQAPVRHTQHACSPPIETVIFGWGVTEDGQLALGQESRQDIERPSVIESLLGTSFSGFRFNRRPLVAGSRHTLAITEAGKVLSWGWNDRGTLGLGHRCAIGGRMYLRVKRLQHRHLCTNMLERDVLQP